MGLLPLVAQEVGRDAGENDAAADQAFERRRPEGHDDHEDAAQNKGDGDKQRNLREREQRFGSFSEKPGRLRTRSAFCEV